MPQNKKQKSGAPKKTKTGFSIRTISREIRGGGIIHRVGSNSLAKQLTEDYGKGYTATNLRYMRQFYLQFKNHHALRHKLIRTNRRKGFLFEVARPKRGFGFNQGNNY